MKWGRAAGAARGVVRRARVTDFGIAAVAEAIAIGIPDDYLGQVPKLFVALRPGTTLTAEELSEFLSLRINKIELPAQIEFRASLPKTMIGKLSKKELVAEEKSKRD